MPDNSLQNKTKNLIVRLWWHMPFKRGMRQHIKTVFFTLFGFLFRNTRPYKNWIEIRKLSKNIAFPESVEYPENWTSVDESISRLKTLPINLHAEPIKRVDIVVHAFYPDILEDIAKHIESEFRKIPEVPVKVLVSTTSENQATVTNILKETHLEFQIEVFPNHGRDILPFLSIARKISDPDTMVLKLHTKRSDHRLTGSLWRKELFDNLLSGEKIKQAMDYFNEHSEIGIIGPKGNIVPMNLYFGGNALALSYYCRIFSVSAQDLQRMTFVAGSMFFARLSALNPIIALDIPVSMFEPETGQNDGTMAHAIERVFSLSARYGGMTLTDTSFPVDPQTLKITKEHPFTW